MSTDDQKRLLDWAQAYGQKQVGLGATSPAAVYVANTGFGYGDTKTVDLSERLMRQFARNLNTYGTIGEQWVRALHSYYRQAGAYDVVDLKVMAEATMYGLPFYGYADPGHRTDLADASDDTPRRRARHGDAAGDHPVHPTSPRTTPVTARSSSTTTRAPTAAPSEA